MKSVGILTMHRVINYGSVLQAYATQRIVEKLGYKAIIIDYVYPNKYHLKQKHNPIRLFLSAIYHTLFPTTNDYKTNKIIKFRKKYLHLSSDKYQSPDELKIKEHPYDIYLVGSDQVWNPIHMKGDGSFLLNFISDYKPKISFSSSFAIKELPDRYINYYKRSLEKFDYISVRENNGKELIKKLIGKDISVTLDPTLMLEPTEWKCLMDGKPNKYIDQKYILLYALNYAFDPAPYIYDLLFELQNKTGLKIYSFTELPEIYNDKNIEYIIDSSPIEFLQAFECASYVVTSSFHGTAFAVNFGVPLYSVISDTSSTDDRQACLLKALNITNCLIKKNSSIKMPEEIIYERENVKKKLNKLRSQSLNYLSEALINSLQK